MSINLINIISNPVFLSGAQNSTSQSSNGAIMMLVFYVVIFALLYLIFIRPSSKKKKEEAEMRNQLEIGDEITTIGGIMGRVVAIKEDEEAIIIETGADRVKMKLKKWCISTVDTVKTPANAPEKNSKSKKDKDSKNKE